MGRHSDRQLLRRSRRRQPAVGTVGSCELAFGQFGHPAQFQATPGFPRTYAPAAFCCPGDPGRELLWSAIATDPASADRANPIGYRSGRPRGDTAHLGQRPRLDRERTVGGEGSTDRPRPQRRVPIRQHRPCAHAVTPTAPAAPPPPGGIGETASRCNPAPGTGRAARPSGLLKERNGRRLILKGAIHLVDRNRTGIAQRDSRHCDNPISGSDPLRHQLEIMSSKMPRLPRQGNRAPAWPRSGTDAQREPGTPGGQGIRSNAAQWRGLTTEKCLRSISPEGLDGSALHVCRHSNSAGQPDTLVFDRSEVEVAVAVGVVGQL